VRRLCTACKKVKPASEGDVKAIQSILDSIKNEGKDFAKYGLKEGAPIKIYEAPGCDACNTTGYKGRIGIFEAIKTDEAIEKIIPENPSEREIKQVAKTQGILSMRQDGIIKILKGVTSLEEVASVVDLNEE
jgi:type IV pilus assembly protein PilB